MASKAAQRRSGRDRDGIAQNKRRGERGEKRQRRSQGRGGRRGRSTEAGRQTTGCSCRPGLSKGGAHGDAWLCVGQDLQCLDLQMHVEAGGGNRKSRLLRQLEVRAQTALCVEQPTMSPWPL